MFNLPTGKSVNENVDLSIDATQMPFDYGIISHYSGRRKLPIAHRFVCDGLVVGWISEGDEKNTYLAGKAARAKIMALGNEKIRLVGHEYTSSNFAAIASKLPESFPEISRLGPLMPKRGDVADLASQDLAALAEVLSQKEPILGTLAFEDGMIISSHGELPANDEDLAIQCQEHLTRLESLRSDLELTNMLRTSIWFENGVLLLASAGSASLALWTRHKADHQALLSNALALLEAGRETTPISIDTPLPEGFILKETKGGIDKIISLLSSAHGARTSGYLRAEKGEWPVELILESGVPVGIRAPEGADLAGAIHDFTQPSRELSLHRLDKIELLIALAGRLQSWSLEGMCEELSTTRSKSEKRIQILTHKLDELFGFDVGLEVLTDSRVKWSLDEEANIGTAILRPVMSRGDVLAPVDSNQDKAIENLELELTAAKKNASASKRQAIASRKSAESAVDELRLANERINDLRTSVESLHKEIDDNKTAFRQLTISEDDANARAAKLSKRITFLEHQLSERAAELAKAIGDSETSTKLREDLEALSLQEVELKAELETDAERLSNVRQQMDADERRQRLLSEQVGALRDRHRQAQSETQEVEIRLNERRTELTAVEAETHTTRRMMDDHDTRATQAEVRAAHAQAELRELMEERRTLLRELGDLSARRGQNESELRTLIEQAGALSEAHEEALDDIEEAERIRARLAEEPLAQALLGEEASFSALGPVLDRLEHARDLGYSVTLLDRAVERGLAVIQHTVEHVAKTPRYLLSREVMDLLERQAPETAGTVRGLTRWSVQQRLEHRLGETVTHVVLDLERLLEDFEQSITMLRRLRSVLDSLDTLGAPSEEIVALQNACRRPEALPQISQAARGIIRKSLDDIYLESDQRDAGAAVRLEQTTQVLEELIDQIDGTGLSSGTPQGPLWDFQRSGLLPHESLDGNISIAVPNDALDDMNRSINSLEGTEGVSETNQSEQGNTEVATEKAPTLENEPIQEIIVSEQPVWQELPPPEDDPRPNSPLVSSISAALNAGTEATATTSENDERAKLEEELARLDAAWETRKTGLDEVSSAADLTSGALAALAELESDLADIDL